MQYSSANICHFHKKASICNKFFRMKNSIALLLVVLVAMSFTPGPQSQPFQAPDPANPQAPNVIFMIGDGMGIAQLSSVYFSQDAEPHFNRFPVTGLVKTSSSSHKITDSAAGATAYSCGEKTYNGAIGVAPDSTTALPTILETLAGRGYQTGLVSTSSITHATPASYFAHTNLRKNEEEIAEQLVDAPVNFFAGGGREFFFDRADNRNLLPELEQHYVMDTTQLREAAWDPSKNYGYLLAADGMPPILEGRGDFLPRATRYALDYFSQSPTKPFFMMVEGSQIDWGGHANNGEYLASEARDFDAAIGEALAFAERQGNTIVIVTADHECGGFTLASTEKEVPFMGKQRDYDDLDYRFSTGGHSAAMVPLLAYGPGTEIFTGIYENTQAYHKLMRLLP